jgi:hypothetical protein
MRSPFTMVLLSVSLVSAPCTIRAQPWSYDFGTSTGSFSSGVSTTFLPATGTNGGTPRVRIGRWQF